MPVADIAHELGIPRNYLSKILHGLARSDILSSTRGPSGGFRLARPAHDISLSDVVRHFDDVPSASSCVLGLERCSDVNACPAHDRWMSVRSNLIDFLDNTSLADLVNRDAVREPPAEGTT